VQRRNAACVRATTQAVEADKRVLPPADVRVPTQRTRSSRAGNAQRALSRLLHLLHRRPRQTAVSVAEISHCSWLISRILYGRYLPTVILTIIWYSITHSLFHSRLKTYLFCKSFPPQPYFSSRGFTTWIPQTVTVISEHICFLLFSFSVFTLFSFRFRAVG